MCYKAYDHLVLKSGIKMNQRTREFFNDCVTRLEWKEIPPIHYMWTKHIWTKHFILFFLPESGISSYFYINGTILYCNHSLDREQTDRIVLIIQSKEKTNTLVNRVKRSSLQNTGKNSLLYLKIYHFQHLINSSSP